MMHFKNIDRFLSTVILFAIIIITVVQIVLRSLFSFPLTGVEELQRYLFIAFIFFGIPYSYRMEGHVRLEGFQKYLPEKAKKIVELFVHVSSLTCFAIITISSLYTTMTNYDSSTQTLSIPFWLFFLPTNVGFLLLTIEHYKSLIKAIQRKK